MQSRFGINIRTSLTIDDQIGRNHGASTPILAHHDVFALFTSELKIIRDPITDVKHEYLGVERHRNNFELGSSVRKSLGRLADMFW